MEPFRQRGDSGTLSMREKTLLKRRVTKEHNSNFRAGYVHIDEEQLHKTGIRGRKTYLVYCLIVLLVIMVIVNLLVTLTIMAVLKISKDGITGLEFLPGGVLTRFLGDSVMEDVYPVKNTLGSLPYDNLEISGNNSQSVILKVTSVDGSSVSVGTDKISVDTDLFMVVDPDSGRVIFTTEYDEKMSIPEGTDKIKLKQVVTSRITCRDDDLTFINSNGDVTVRGSEGLVSQSDSVDTQSGRLNIDSDGGIHLSGADGIYIDEDLPLYDGEATSQTTRKLCVAMPAGRLFTVPAGTSCDEEEQ